MNTSRIVKVWREGGMPLLLVAVGVTAFATEIVATRGDPQFLALEIVFLAVMVVLAVVVHALQQHVQSLSAGLTECKHDHRECERRLRTMASVVMRFLAFEADNVEARRVLISELRELDEEPDRDCD